MTILREVLERVSRLLELQGVPWALVGGMAVSAWTEPRFTADIDIATAMSDEEVGEFILSARRRGYTVNSVLEREDRVRIASLRLVENDTEHAIVVYVLVDHCGVEAEVSSGAHLLELADGFEVPVASMGHLLAMKLLSRSADRPTDDADIRSLLRTIDGAEVERARETVRLISERGCAQGEDLGALLSEALRAR